jgi:hypothetical protein
MTATITFADFAATQQAREEIAANVLRHTYALIEALKDNYREYSIRGHQRYVEKGESVEYHQQRIDELKNGILPLDYEIKTGKKYHKVIMLEGGGGRSAHAFIDKQTGEVYMSASWRSAAKGVRYDLRSIQDREYLLQNADWAGGYLYAK